jgi:hypothetical protein
VFNHGAELERVNVTLSWQKLLDIGSIIAHMWSGGETYDLIKF